MIKKSADTYDFNDLIHRYNFTFAHQLSGLVNENALSIINNVRVFKDSSTDAFVKNIFGNTNTKILFLDYTFHFINSMIKAKINDYLIENSQLPLYADENIYVVFKGGNVMNYFMELYIKKIEDIFKDISLENVTNKYRNPYILGYTIDDDKTNTSLFSSFFTKLKENFKISDIDYSVYIKASNYARYILIHGGIVRILGQILSIIAKNFDMLYENNNLDTVSEKIPDTNDDVDDTDIYEEDYHKLKYLIVNEKFNKYLDMIKNNTPFVTEGKNTFDTEFFDDILKSLESASKFIKNIQKISNSINNFTKIYQLITIIQYLQTLEYLKFANNKSNISLSNIKNMRNLFTMYLEKLIEKKFDNIRTSNFYNETSIQNIKSDLVKKLSELTGKVGYEENNNGLVTTIKKYELVNTPKISNIEFRKRYDLLIKSNNDPIDQYIHLESNKENLHYITFNSIINSVKKTGISNFNLMRIKINIMLTGKNMKIDDHYSDMSIPSEFVDVSIPFYDDSTGNKFIESVKKEPTKIFLKNSTSKKNIVIQSYGLNDLTHDLINVLFVQNFFIPWLDLKYNKRIFRMLFIGILNAYINDCTVKCNSKSIKIYKNMLDLSSTILNYMIALSEGQKPLFPYIMCGKFIDTTNYSHDHIKSEIDDILIRYKNTFFVNLINIREEYHEITELINFIIVYSRYVTFSDDDAYHFINKNRSDYLYVPLEKNTFSEYSKNSNSKFIDMLKIIVNDGYKLYFMFENLVDLRKKYDHIDLNPESNNKLYKYIKYKAKYLALKDPKINSRI